MLETLSNKIWNEPKHTNDWKVAILLPICKKGDNRDCRNYRRISLISLLQKIYERIQEKGLKIVIEQQLEDPQNLEFRKARGMHDVARSEKKSGRNIKKSYSNNISEN